MQNKDTFQRHVSFTHPNRRWLSLSSPPFILLCERHHVLIQGWCDGWERVEPMRMWAWASWGPRSTALFHLDPNRLSCPRDMPLEKGTGWGLGTNTSPVLAGELKAHILQKARLLQAPGPKDQHRQCACLPSWFKGSGVAAAATPLTGRFLFHSGMRKFTQTKPRLMSHHLFGKTCCH